MTPQFIAKVCHEVNRQYCEYIGDHSQKPWDEAEDWQRDSAVSGVLAFQANPSMTPEEQHERWMAEKEAEGWTYGETKNAEAKTHPCMVPYDQLPPAQQMKDALFQGTIRMLLEAEGRPI